MLISPISFAICAIALLVMGYLILVNLSFVHVLFEVHWILGLLSLVASICGWSIVLWIAFSL